MFRHSNYLLAGHNRMSKILRGKGLADAAKAIAFSRVSRRITAAARGSGVSLTDALQEAKNLRVPKDLIERALKNASGDGALLEPCVYEGTVSGVAIIIEALTDNKNRTGAAMRSLLTKAGGSLGPSAWAFKVLGRISIAGSSKDAKFMDNVIAAAVDAGAIDVEMNEEEEEDLVAAEEDEKNGEGGVNNNEGAIVFCDKDKLGQVRTKLEELKLSIRSSQIVRIPESLVSIQNEEEEESLRGLLDALERNEDVQKVEHNASFNNE